MKKNTIIIIAILVLLVIAAGVYVWVKNTGKEETSVASLISNDVSKGKMVTGSGLETFSGKITAVDTGCFYDAICSVTVDGKKIILVKGGRGLDPNIVVGKLIGVASIGDLEQKIGQDANVYAGLTPEGDYSIYGNDKYYVEVLSNK